MTHTPGPWNVIVPEKTGGALGDAGDRGIESAGVAIAEAWEHCPTRGNPDGTRVDAAANARLIASAPDLVTAMQCAKGYMLNAIIDLQTGTKKSTTEATLNGGIRLIDAALAKAGVA